MYRKRWMRLDECGKARGADLSTFPFFPFFGCRFFFLPD
jgi:hypothetical protein